MRSLMRMDEELQVLFQRINKKSIKARQTRIKSLKRLAELISSKDANFLEGFVKIYAIVYEKLILSENDSEILSLNQKCLEAVLVRNKRAVMKSYQMFFPQMILASEESHEEPAKLAQSNLLKLVTSQERLGKGASMFSDRFIILLGPLLNNSVLYLKEIGCDDDPKVLATISEKLCLMSLKALSKVLSYVAALQTEELIAEGFECYRMMLFEESVPLGPEPNAIEILEILPKQKKKKKKKKQKAAKKKVKCFDVLEKFPKSKGVRGALVQVLEQLFLTGLDRFLSNEVRTSLVKKMFSSFLVDQNVLIQKHFYARDLLHRLLGVAAELKIKVDSKRVFESVLSAIRNFSFVIGKPFYKNVLNVVKVLEFTGQLDQDFLENIGAMLEAFCEGFLESRLRHQVDNHFAACFEIAEWVLFERINLENEPELVFADRVVHVFANVWLQLYLDRHNPDQKSFFVVGVNELKYIPQKIVSFLQTLKRKFSTGRVNRFRIIEKMFLEEIYLLVKTQMPLALGCNKLVRNLQNLIFEFSKNIIQHRELLLDEVFPFKPGKSLGRTLTQAKLLAKNSLFRKNTDASFLSRKTKQMKRFETTDIYSAEVIEEEIQSQFLEDNDNFEMSEWSRTGSDVVSLGRSASMVIRRVSDFSNVLLLGGPSDSNTKIYKDDSVGLLEISFDVVSLTIHCLMEPLEMALRGLLDNQGQFDASLKEVLNIAAICSRVLNPLGLVYYRSSTTRGKMETVVDHFVYSVEKVFTIQVLKHSAEKKIMNRIKLRRFYMGLTELFKSLSAFVSLEKLAGTLQKLFQYFQTQQGKMSNRASLCMSKFNSGEEEAVDQDNQIHSLQKFKSFSKLGSEVRNPTIENLNDQTLKYALTVHEGKISSIKMIKSQSNLAEKKLRPSESLAYQVILEESEHDESAKKAGSLVDTGLKDFNVSNFQVGSLEIPDPSELEREEADEVAELEENKKKYSNAFKLFHARMFNSMLHEDQNLPACKAIFPTMNPEEEAPKKPLSQQKWKPKVLRVKEYFSILVHTLFGIKEIYQGNNFLESLIASEEMIPEDRQQVFSGLIKRLETSLNKREFSRDKNQVMSLIQSMKDFIGIKESQVEIEDLESSPLLSSESPELLQRAKSIFHEVSANPNKKEKNFNQLNHELFGGILLARRLQRNQKLDIIPSLMELSVSYGHDELILVTKFLLKFDEKDLFFHRAFLDSIQKHLKEVSQINRVVHKYTFLDTPVENGSHSKTTTRSKQSRPIKYYNCSVQRTEPETKKISLHIGSEERLIQIANLDLAAEMMKEKGLEIPLTYSVDPEETNKKQSHFFNQLLLEKGKLLRVSIEEFEKIYLKPSNNNNYLGSIKKTSGELHSWTLFWTDFVEYVFSFGLSRIQSALSRPVKSPLRKQFQQENLIFNLDMLLDEMLVKPKISLKTRHNIFQILLQYIINRDLVSRETMTLLNKIAWAICQQNEEATGDFISTQIMNLFFENELFDLRIRSHMEIIISLVASFPRLDFEQLLYEILRRESQSDDLSLTKELSLVIQLVNKRVSLFKFVEGHKHQSQFWSEVIPQYLLNGLERVILENPVSFVFIVNKLLWFGARSSSLRLFLIELIEKTLADKEDPKKLILDMILRQLLSFVLGKICQLLKTESEQHENLSGLVDFYMRLLIALPPKFCKFDLAFFMDLGSEAAILSQYSRKEQVVEQSLGYMSFLEISSILCEEPLIQAINGVVMHLHKSSLLKEYFEKVKESLPESDEIEEAVLEAGVASMVSQSISELVKLHSIHNEMLEMSRLETNLSKCFELQKALNILQEISESSTTLPDIQCQVSSIYIQCSTWLLSTNKVEMFTERVEHVESQIKNALSICREKESSFWRSVCMSLLKFTQRVILYLEMFSEDVQANLMGDTIQLALEFTKEFDSRSLQNRLIQTFVASHDLELGVLPTALNTPHGKEFKEEELSEIFEDFCVEVAETLSRFALRHNLEVRANDIISLLGSSIPQFRKAAFFLLVQTENSILVSKFTEEEMKNPPDDGDLDESAILKRDKVREQSLLSHLNKGYLQFFKTEKMEIGGMHLDTLKNSEQDPLQKTFNMDKWMNEKTTKGFSLSTSIDYLFPFRDEESSSSDVSKVLEVSAFKFEKKILTKLMFWSVMLRLADNEWDSVNGDQMGHFLGSLFQCNPAQCQHLLEEVFLYARYRQSQIQDMLTSDKSLDFSSETISTDKMFLSPDKLLEVSQNISDWELCTTFTLNIIYMFASRFPRTLRKFLASSQRKKIKSFAERLMTQGLSNAIFCKEIKGILAKKETWEAEDFMVSFYPRSQEIIACLIKDEANIQMNIQIHERYPLKMASIQIDKGIKISEKKVTKWLLMMKRLLSNHNVGIVTALELWKTNVENQFDGIEPCPICYYVIHFANKEMPTKSCRTCKNKFHSSCIHKWFQTSSKAECPMCKSQFI